MVQVSWSVATMSSVQRGCPENASMAWRLARDAAPPASAKRRSWSSVGGVREAQPVSRAPDDGAGLDVEGGEGAVAARVIEELACALEPDGAATAPREPPPRLTARQVDGDEVALPFGENQETREAREVDDGACGRATDAWGEPGSERDLAGAEDVDGELTVRVETRDAAGGDDAGRLLGGDAPEDLATRTVERERLVLRADDEAISAEERGAQIDPRDERMPARRVAKTGRRLDTARGAEDGVDAVASWSGEGAVRLGRRVGLPSRRGTRRGGGCRSRGAGGGRRRGGGCRTASDRVGEARGRCRGRTTTLGFRARGPKR